MRRALLFALAILVAVPPAIHGQKEANPRPPADTTYDRVVLINLGIPAAAAESRIITFAPDRGLLASLDSAAARPIRKGVDTLLITRAKAREVKPANRWIASTDARLAVFVFHDEGTVANIRFNEEARRTRLAADLLVLAELGLQVGAQSVTRIVVTKQEYTLRRPRANLTISAALAPPAPVVQAGAGSAGAGATGGNTTATQPAPAATKPVEQTAASITVVTGPAEHLFLSANAGATDASALKYDDESNSLQLKENPTGFFVGFNYSFGDILTDPAETDAGVLRRFWEGMYVGGAVQGSRRPFDQAGVHMGFRYNPLPLLGDVLNFETVSPYMGLVWTKNDQVDAEGNRLGDRRYGRGEFVWGVSLNLDKALGWVGGGEN
jgi:hypothetical protein